MIRYNENGKIQSVTLEIVPDNNDREAVKKFAALSPELRAAIIQLGMEVYEEWQEDDNE